MPKTLTLPALKDLLQSRFKEGFLSLRDLPQPSAFKDMQRATERIVSAIHNHEKITVIGDYDVDGVTATTLMIMFFEEIEYPIEWVIPNRFTDGYGLSEKIIPRIEGCDLAITVDNGISAVNAAKLCKAHHIDLIITDHHLLPPEIPEAYAIIDQKQPSCTFPYDEVCGAQIAWYLIASVKNALNVTIDMKAYMALVSIAIIADMMPLVHINRVMVENGLTYLAKSTKPAIRAYLEHVEKETLSAEDIGFFLAPILNAAGRMDDASHAVKYLTSTNIHDARIRLSRLIDFNTQRKASEQQITHEALQQVEKDDAVIVVEGEGWHEGVVGIVAARVARSCEKPTIVLTQNEEGLLKGSGRSFGACDLFALVENCRDDLEKFGGHQAAIGLSLKPENLQNFKKKLEHDYQRAAYHVELEDPDILGELPFSEISFELTGMMKEFEPYGQGNPVPKFITHHVEVLQQDTMGKEGEHLRFSLAHEGVVFPAVQFKAEAVCQVGERVSVVYTLNENTFRGRTSLQLMIEKIIV